MQGSWYWSGAHCKNMNMGFELLDSFFVFDAETLLLINDKKAKICKANIVGQKSMCTNGDVDLSGFESIQDFLCLRFGAKPIEELDVDCFVSKALPKTLTVLFSQDSCRREDRNLFFCKHGHVGCPHGDFRFSKANITAE